MEAKYTVNKTKCTPYMVTIDFSWPLILTVISVFNKSDIRRYLEDTFEACFRTVHIKTHINICTAHILHAVSRKLDAERVGKEPKIFIKHIVAALILEFNITSFTNAVYHIFLVFCSKYRGIDVENSLAFLHAYIQHNSNSDQQASVVSASTSNTLEGEELFNEASLRTSSPFVLHFNESITRAQKQCALNTYTKQKINIKIYINIKINININITINI